MADSYAWEKLFTAVLILAGGSGSLRERLADAYTSSLIRIRPERHFPDADTREKYVNLLEEIAPGGRFNVALSMWPEHDLRRIVEGLVGLYDTVARRKGDA
jgi:hypothetical protein